MPRHRACDERAVCEDDCEFLTRVHHRCRVQTSGTLKKLARIDRDTLRETLGGVKLFSVVLHDEWALRSGRLRAAPS